MIGRVVGRGVPCARPLRRRPPGTARPGPRKTVPRPTTTRARAGTNEARARRPTASKAALVVGQVVPPLPPSQSCSRLRLVELEHERATGVPGPVCGAMHSHRYRKCRVSALASDSCVTHEHTQLTHGDSRGVSGSNRRCLGGSSRTTRSRRCLLSLRRCSCASFQFWVAPTTFKKTHEHRIRIA